MSYMALSEDSLDTLRYLLSGVFCALGGARDGCVGCVTRSARGAVVAIGRHCDWTCSCSILVRNQYLFTCESEKGM
jgi:hypothetical protein